MGDSSLVGLTPEEPIYIQKLVSEETTIGSVKISGQTITTTATNGSLSLLPNGTGNVLLPVAAPTVATAATSKQYVDTKVATVVGDSPATKVPARVKTQMALAAYTAAGSGATKTLTATANGALTIDTVSVVAGDRVLVDAVGAAAPVDAGIYTVTSAGSGTTPWVLTRAADMNTGSQVMAGTNVVIGEGAANALREFIISNAPPIVIDTTPLVFTLSVATTAAGGSNSQVQFNAAGALSGTTGLVFDGANTLSVNRVAPTSGSLGLVDGASGGVVLVGSMAGQSVTGSSVAYGASSTAADGGVALGRSATASGTDSTAVGRSTTASAAGATAVGQAANASATNAVAVGQTAAASATNAVAIGLNSRAALTDTWNISGLPVLPKYTGAVGIPAQIATAPLVVVSTLAIPTNTGLGVATSIVLPTGGLFYINEVYTILSVSNGANQNVNFSIGDASSATKYLTTTTNLNTLTAGVRTVDAGIPNTTSPVTTSIRVTTNGGFAATAGGQIRVMILGLFVQNDP